MGPSAVGALLALRNDKRTQAIVAGLEDSYLGALLNEYATTGRVAQIFDGKGHVVVGRVLGELKTKGTFGKLRDVKGACMTHVVFQRRYQGKPDCLKW